MKSNEQDETSSDIVKAVLEARVIALEIELRALRAELRNHGRYAPQAYPDKFREDSSNADRTDLITASEAASILGVCHKTITVWQQKGIIPGVKIGRLYKFSRPAIESLLPD